eukprot:TRINITY_DN62809_c0_g1_i1.p1 TRINITY_DN62809_c0_g1~~TRINITY_DN62809_c0_g1_i1.p1  ORF type:complete len:130 (-),score=49.62 TRINITY_DN62809_c0_g1_i1:117-506(-)
MIRRPPRSTLSSSSAASDVYKRQALSVIKMELEPMVAAIKLCNKGLELSEDQLDALLKCAPTDEEAAAVARIEGDTARLGKAERFVSLVSGTMVSFQNNLRAVSYTHLRAHETPEHLVCRLLLEKKKKR